MNKIFYILLIISFQASAQLQDELTSFVQNSANESATISFALLDLESDELLHSYDGEKRLITASTMKLWSTAYALEVLGADFRPLTKLFIDGELDSAGVLHGNLIVQGGGDPGLGSRYFGKEEDVSFLRSWSKVLIEKGITKIDGVLHIDGAALPYNNMVDGWTWGDIGNYYGAQASGLMLCDNTQFLHFRTGTPGSNTKLTRFFPPMENFVFENQIMSENHRSDRSMIYGAPFQNYRYGSGSLPSNRADYTVKGSLPDPEVSLGILFIEELQKQGIEIDGYSTQRLKPTPYLANQQIHAERGPSIIDIARLTNEKSINIFAEQLVALAWLNSGKKSQDIYEEYRKFWTARLQGAPAVLNDGSGLARTNGVSALQFCKMLKYVHTQEYAEDFKSTLPIAGVSGTVKSLCAGGPGSGKIQCKSGTMSGIKSFAGYATSKSGRKLAFAIIVNQHDFPSSASITREISKVLNAMILTY